MGNPDTDYSLSLSLPIGFLFLALIMVLFQFKTIKSFNILLYAGIPILGFIVAFFVNLVTQYTDCMETNFWSAVQGAVPSIFTILLALLIASRNICRRPIVSCFGPLFIKDEPVKTDPKACCPKTMGMECVEKTFPIVQGIAHGFYVMFGVFFGIAIGNSYSSIC